MHLQNITLEVDFIVLVKYKLTNEYGLLWSKTHAPQPLPAPTPKPPSSCDTSFNLEEFMRFVQSLSGFNNPCAIKEAEASMCTWL